MRIIDNDELGVDIFIRNLRQFMNVGQQRLHFRRFKKPLIPDQLLIVGNNAHSGIKALNRPLEKFEIHILTLTYS
jgi:chemotaxis methyl-accepting protein methylase